MMALTGRVSAVVLLCFLLVPIAVLLFSSSPSEIGAGLRHPLFVPSLLLSAQTTFLSLLLITATGTPLAWWLASTRTRSARVVEALVDLPIVLPPAVLGVALLQTFGRRGLLGPALEPLGATLPFTTSAVVIAQVVVAAPFYVQAAANAFRKVDDELLLVARTLGASRGSAFLRVAVPIALPGLFAGAALAWARAIGEFGATLLFAGNMTGRTQTMPLAIYTALESDVRGALAISLVLAGLALLLLLALRAGPHVFRRHT